MSPGALRQQQRMLSTSGFVQPMLEGLSHVALVLNTQRQILFANSSFISSLKIEDADQLIGLRPGEAVRCIRAENGPDGCGTSPHCAVCGAVTAVLEAIDSHTIASRECTISIERNGKPDQLNLMVTANPISINGDHFVIVSMADISAEKHRQLMERLFFHDAINIAGSIDTLLGIFEGSDDPVGQFTEVFPTLRRSFARLTQEILSHRQMLAAERGDLELRPEQVDSISMLHDCAARASVFLAANEARFEIDEQAERVSIKTDGGILSRVLLNLMKNAAEAAEPGEQLLAGCTRTSCGVRFWVHNACFIPESIQLQIFRCFYSTKGTGRGTGTYGVKLLTEQYLDGRAYFESDPVLGTTFTIEIPSW